MAQPVGGAHSGVRLRDGGLMYSVRLGLLVILLSGLLSACGTFSLGNVKPQTGRTADQEKLDILLCKDQAHNAAMSSGQQTKEFLLGLTIIGAPVAYESDKEKQRQVFKSCMQAKGYVVEAAPEGAPDTLSKLDQAQPAAQPLSSVNSLGLAFPDGWQTKPLTDAQLKRGVAIYATNTTTDSQVLVSAAEVQGITDRNAFVLSRRAAEESRLKDTSHSEVADITVNGRPAKQFQVTGTSSTGPRLTYLTTFVFGQTEVVGVTAWTTAPNFDNQHTALQALAERVSGIQ